MCGSVRSIGKWILCAALVFVGCERTLPDDLPSLMSSMNSNNETTSVAASNKVAKLYGKAGLLQVLTSGGPTARAMSARWLVPFEDAEVERALIATLNNDHDSAVRIRVLWTLKDTGTSASLEAVDRATQDRDAPVAAMARDAASAIRMRSKRG